MTTTLGYIHINNGVYQSSFAKSQEAYNMAVAGVLDGVFSRQPRGLSGKEPTIMNNRKNDCGTSM